MKKWLLLAFWAACAIMSAWLCLVDLADESYWWLLLDVPALCVFLYALVETYEERF